jgi:superfamily II DNA or RNA helicase
MQVQTNPEIELRDYQKEGLRSIRKNYDNGINRQLVAQATGLGKTVQFSHLPAYFPKLTRYGMLVIVHTDELAYQAQETLQWVCPDLRVDLEKAEYEADASANIIVTSRQTLGRSKSRLHKLKKFRQFGIVVTDEAHHVKKGGTYDNILSPLGLGTDTDYSDLLPNDQPRLSVGVTATPNRNDGLGLDRFFSEIASNHGLQWGIRHGYLADVRALQVDTDAHVDNITSRAGDFAVGELSDATDTPARNRVVVNAWKEHVGKPAIAFCVDVDHAHNLAEMFREGGVSAVAIDGTTPKDRRAEIIEQYKNSVIQVITNCQVLTEGFNAPGTHAILMARPTKSTPLYIQMMGRGTRTMPTTIANINSKEDRLKAIEESEKPHVTLIDFVDVSGDHEVVRAPSLFGLSSDFDAEADEESAKKMVGDVVERVEELVEENPYKEEEIRQAESFEEMEVEADKITVFDVAEPNEDIEKMSDYRWMQMGVGTYQLTVPSDRQFEVRLEENMLGGWECRVTYPTQYVGEGDDKRKVEGETFTRNEAYASLKEAVSDMDERISAEHGDVDSLMQHTASWHDGNATSGQKSFLDRLGVDYPDDLSKGEASALIDAKKALLRRRETA